MPSHARKPSRLPKRFVQFRKSHPRLADACEQVGLAVQGAGPLDKPTRELVQLGIAIGARSEGGVHSHTRRALEVGVTPEAIRHATLLALMPLGFPQMMAALSWVEDVLPKKS